MAFKFPSEEWVKALMGELNRSPAYAEAAKTWEGDFYFICDMGAGQPRPSSTWTSGTGSAARLSSPKTSSPNRRCSALRPPSPTGRR